MNSFADHLYHNNPCVRLRGNIHTKDRLPTSGTGMKKLNNGIELKTEGSEIDRK